MPFIYYYKPWEACLMGVKSRGNYQVGCCFKLDCKYHGKDTCDFCLKYDKYEKKDAKRNRRPKNA